jgi:hypothetical protein
MSTTDAVKNHKHGRGTTEAVKLAQQRQARFTQWAKGIDTDHNGQISTAELTARIAQRTTAGKAHPFASSIQEHLSTLDPGATGSVSTQAAAEFLAVNFKVNKKALKKLDVTA